MPVATKPDRRVGVFLDVPLVAQVTARLGETIVALAHVAPGDVFRIGTGPGVELALPGVVEFPLVTGEAHGFVVRRPIGLGAWTGADEVVLADEPVELAVALLTIAISRVDRDVTVVPPPPIDRRPHGFMIASLVVHLLVWGTAVTFAATPRVKPPRPRTQLHPVIARIEPTLPKPPPPPPVQHRAAASPYPDRVATARPGSAGRHAPHDSLIGPNGYADFGAGLAALGKVVDIDWGAKMAAQGPLYQDGAEYKFGSETLFDPNTRAGFETVKTGRFQTVSTGRAVGEDYHLDGETTVQLALCDSPRCEVTGALAKEAVQRVVQRQAAAVAGCVGDQSLVLDLEIAPDGHVVKVHGHGKIARCAAKVIGQLAFPEADGATHAAFTIGYP